MSSIYIFIRTIRRELSGEGLLSQVWGPVSISFIAKSGWVYRHCVCVCLKMCRKWGRKLMAGLPTFDFSNQKETTYRKLSI